MNAGLRKGLTPAEIARFMQTSESTVRGRIAKGVLPSCKIDGRRVVAQADLCVFLDGSLPDDVEVSND